MKLVLYVWLHLTQVSHFPMLADPGYFSLVWILPLTQDPGSFAFQSPLPRQPDQDLSLNFVTAWISGSTHFSFNSLGFHLLAILMHSLSGFGCFCPAWDLSVPPCAFSFGKVRSLHSAFVSPARDLLPLWQSGMSSQAVAENPSQECVSCQLTVH